MRLIVRGLAFAGCAFVLLIVHAACAAGPNQIPWTLSHYQELRSAFHTTESVRAFVYDAISRSGMKDTLDIEYNPPAILDYDFVDLVGDGSLQLIARLDYSGRWLSFYLVAITPAKSGFRLALLDTHGTDLDPISQSVFDLNRDGRKEILVRRPISKAPSRAAPVAFFTDIYVYQDGKFVADDEHFKAYYRRSILPVLTSKLAEEGNSLNADYPRLSPAQLQEYRTNEGERIAALRKSISAVNSFLGKSY